MPREYYRYCNINVYATLIVRVLPPYKTSLIKVFAIYYGTRKSTSNAPCVVRKI